MEYTLAEAARQVLIYIVPLIAAGALAKIGEDASDTATELLGRAWDTLARRFRGHDEAEAALTLFKAKPQDKARQHIIEAQVIERFEADPAAAAELLALAQAIAAMSPPAAPSRQHTQTIGDQANVGVAIAGDHHGNLTIGSLDMSRNKGVPPAAPASAPAASPVVVAPRQRVDDPTLSADGVHFSYGHALIIGVGTYQDRRIRSVPTTANDARAVASLLRDPHLAAYPDAQVRVLLDAKASRTNILDALEDLANRVGDGTALIFFAGHGAPVGADYALLPYDADLNDLATTALTTEVFQQRVAKIRAKAKRLIVLLNCCHAGGVGDTVLGADPDGFSGDAPPADFYRPLAVGSGQVVISSSRPTQKSGAVSQTNPAHTPFGAQLLAALRGKAPGAGAGVGIFELFAYLRAQVPADARHIWYHGGPLVQEPLFYASQLDDNLAVALRPGWQSGTLGDDTLSLAMRLAELELAAEAGALTAAQMAERDLLLTRLVDGA